MNYRNEIDYNNLPKNVAIVMDGNGRWSKRMFLPKKAGHRAGAEALQTLTKEMGRLGFENITVYAFSTENWKRSEDEIYDLMNVLRSFLKKYLSNSNKDNVRIKIIGDISRLDEDIRKQIIEVTELTKDKDGICVNIGINYGGRDEIVRSVKSVVDKVSKGEFDVNELDEETFSKFLDTKEIPDPEILIRTSGEMRLSNFLLWQCAYSEFFFVDKLWPDYKIDDLLKTVYEFQNKERRFGGRLSE